MAEHFEPRAFPPHQPTVINITGDIDLTGYSLESVEFLPEGSTTPIAWSYSDFRVDHTHAMLKATPSSQDRNKLDPVSGTLTVTLSGGSRELVLKISETVTVG